MILLFLVLSSVFTPGNNACTGAVLIDTVRGLHRAATVTYFVSASGTNEGNGTKARPYTLAQVNAKSFRDGDSVLFKRGDSFYGSLRATASNVHYADYGKGRKPVINGFTVISDWKNQGGNIWQANCAACGVAVNMLVIDDKEVPMGRYPNKAYLMQQSASTTSITSTALAGSPNWMGAELVTRDARYIINRRTITRQFGETLEFAKGTVDPKPGWGFFIQNHPATLDENGEWYYDAATRNILIYSKHNPSGSVIRVATVDRFLDLQSVTGVTFDNISFIGANVNAVEFGNIKGVRFTGCELLFSGANAIIGGGGCTDMQIQNCLISDANANGIYGVYGTEGFRITGNTIKKIAVFAGMSTGEGVSQAANLAGRKNIFSRNRIDSIGYIGITFNGDSSAALYNYITNFCLTKDDGAGIYTQEANYIIHTGSRVFGNIVTDGYGNNEGTPDATRYANGIYLDLGANGLRVAHNTVTRCAYAGIFGTQLKNVLIDSNTMYNNGVELYFLHTHLGKFFFSDNKVIGNHLVNTKRNHLIDIITDFNDVSTMADFDRNCYSVDAAGSNYIYIQTTAAGGSGAYHLSSWKLAYKKDEHTIEAINPNARLAYNPTGATREVNAGGTNKKLPAAKNYDRIKLAPYTSRIINR